MADYSAQDLLKQAVLATRQQNLPAARKLIQASIRKDPNSSTAWLVYASIAETKREKLLCLKRVMELDPNNAQAAKMMQSLGIAPEQLIGNAPAAPQPEPPTAQPSTEPDRAPTEETPTPESTSAPAPAAALFSFQQDAETEEADTTSDFLTYTEETVAPPPVEEQATPTTEEPFTDSEASDVPARTELTTQVEPPRPAPRSDSFEERLNQSADQAETIVNEFLTLPPDDVTWVKKEKNRAGENEILAVRAAVATSLLTFVGLPLVIIGAILYNTPIVQAVLDPDQSLASAFTGSTLTPTPTPPTTPTNTPGFTPTPSITPPPTETQAQVVATGTPTAIFDFPRGNADINFIEPTELVVPGNVANRLVDDGIQRINDEQPEDIIPALATERAGYSAATFDARVFYTEAFAQARLGEFEDALDILAEAEDLLSQTNQESTLPRGVLLAGYARVYFEQGRQRQAAGDNASAIQSFTQAERNAREAIDEIPDSDADWAEPRLILVESLVAMDNLNAALVAIDEALAVQQLREDVRFFVLRGEILLQQERLQDAEDAVFIALYIDPISAEAHDLRTRLALTQEDASLASLYAQTYLYYHPLVVRGWEMLGAARTIEGNTNLALEAYTQAITVGENTDQPLAVNAYINRANIYEQRGQLDLALADVTAAAEATENPTYQQRQLYLMLDAGMFTEARELAVALQEDGVITRGEANFVEARVLLAITEAPTEGDYAEVSRLIDNGFASIPDAYKPLANQLRAEAYLAQGEPQIALEFAQDALNIEESAEIRLLLGNIYTVLEQFPEAIGEFRRVQTLDQLYSVPDELVDAADRGIFDAEGLRDRALDDAP